MLPGALEYSDKYLHEQLLASLEGHREIVASALGRFDILWKMARELILPTALAAGLFWLARRTGDNRLAEIIAGGVAGAGPKGSPGGEPAGSEPQRRVAKAEPQTSPNDRASPTSPDRRPILFCLLTAASASLPIMASPKQSGHYAFPSYAFFALAIALWCAPAVIHLFTAAGAEASLARSHRRLRYAAAAVLALLVAASCVLAGRPHKDKDVYRDTLVLGHLLSKSTIVGLAPDLAADYPLQTNLARWNFIAADRATAGHEYLIAPITSITAPSAAYVEVPTKMSRYRLFRRTAVALSPPDEPASTTAADPAAERGRSRN